MRQLKHRPYVPDTIQMREFTVRAVLLGLVLCVVLGAANAYLGLRAGQTVAATFPAAVVSMAVLRVGRGSILEENLARTAGSIGESVAAGAIFTIPAFVLTKAWPNFAAPSAYFQSTILMMTGGILGVLFVSLMRRVMVEDPELPFPESVAASEIHKAGQEGARAAKYLFYNIGFGGLIFLLGALGIFATDRNFIVRVGTLGRSVVRLGGDQTARSVPAGATSVFAAPSISPAYVGVGYIIGLRLSSLTFAGSVFAWGLMIPVLMFFLGPQLATWTPVPPTETNWAAYAAAIWRFIVRPIAVGGMMVGAAYTLFRMRKNLGAGLARALAEVRHGAVPQHQLGRTERYMSSKAVFGGIGLISIVMGVVYIYFSGQVVGGIVAAIVMLFTGFFFAAASGNLVGVIGSSNNPISGLTLSTLIIAALLMVTMGVSGTPGVIAVLGVAAVVCVSSAVAGELLQDFKVGYILGGTPRTIQIVEIIAVICASLVMYFPLLVLHTANIKSGGTGFGDPKLSAPQAGLMASLAQGIVGGDMPWPLVVAGMLLGIAFILIEVRSPMLFAVGMYLPLATTSAIFVGGVLKWAMDRMRARRGFNEAQVARIENIGILVASGLIAGEALMGLVTATFQFFDVSLPQVFREPSYWVGLLAMAAMVWALVGVPLANPGRPEDPAPPTAIM